VVQWNKVFSTLWSEVPGFQSGYYEDSCRLGHCAVWSGRSLPKFQRYFLPISLGWWALEAASTSAISVKFYQITGFRIAGESHLCAMLLEKKPCSIKQIFVCIVTYPASLFFRKSFKFHFLSTFSWSTDLFVFILLGKTSYGDILMVRDRH
jgi:hypothetical protein